MHDAPPIIAQPDDIRAELASRAFAQTSFTPEQRAESRRKGYAEDVNGLYPNCGRSRPPASRKNCLPPRWKSSAKATSGDLNGLSAQPFKRSQPDDYRPGPLSRRSATISEAGRRNKPSPMS